MVRSTLMMSSLIFSLAASAADDGDGDGDGDFVAFESAHVRPLALAPAGRHLYAVNTPDNRLEIFRPEHGTLLFRGETLVGLEPVAVAARRDEAFVVNHLSDSVSVVDVSDPGSPFVKRTLLVGDEPRDIVIAAGGRRIFVTCARRGQNRPGDAELTTNGVGRADVWVFEADDLGRPPHVVTLFCDTPRALATSADGSRVYAAAFHSGNRTTTLHRRAVDPFFTFLMNDGFIAPDLPPPTANAEGITGPRTGLIVRYDGERWLDAAGRDWSPRVRFDLPDVDLFVIDAESDPPRGIAGVSGIGTVVFDIAVHPDGRVFVSNLESRNHVRFEPALRGYPVENRVTIVSDATAGEPRVDPVSINPHLDRSSPFGSADEIERSLSLPTALELSSSGDELYIAALGSGQVAILDGAGIETTRIDVGDGPSGLALHESAERLYVMNRFDHTISVVDLETRQESSVVPLRFNPEPAAVRDGRPLLYDARASSGHGDSSCASCHIFGDLDGLAWNLGDPTALIVPNPLTPAPVLNNDVLTDFHPLKGPMTTQSLRGLAGGGAMHWRGDRATFMAFRPAFQSLLGRETEYPEEDMERLRDFVLALRYPPNPIAPLDGSRTPELDFGERIFESSGTQAEFGGDGNPCTACHALPTGSAGTGVNVDVDHSFEVPHLRNLYQKVGMFGWAPPGIVQLLPRVLDPTPTPDLGAQVRGFGFTHDGAVPTLFDFLRQSEGVFGFLDDRESTAVEKMRALEAFMLSFPTGLAPIVGQQITLAIPLEDFAAARFELMLERAMAGDGDLVLHGRVDGRARGFLLDIDGVTTPAAAVFQSDRRAERLDRGALDALLEIGVTLTASVVPPGSGPRIGIDRDADGALDGDELDAGFDPTDASSRPPLPLVHRGDCNGDTLLDVSDAIFTLTGLFLDASATGCPTACDATNDGRLDLSDAVRTLNVLFQGGPAPDGFPDCVSAPDACLEACAQN